MFKHCLFAAGILFAVAGCEKKEAPTPAEKSAAASAQVEAQKAEAAKDRAEKAVDVAKDKADHAVDVAKEKADRAEDRAAAAKDKAENIADKANVDKDDLKVADRKDVDWNGPGDNWDSYYVGFAEGTDRTGESGDYAIERGKDGTITAWRKTKQVAGNQFAELKDATLVTQVKAKLAADDNTRAHKIDVDAEDHTVTLKGNVSGAKEAAQAVRVALSTPGTEKVVSHLTWKK